MKPVVLNLLLALGCSSWSAVASAQQSTPPPEGEPAAQAPTQEDRAGRKMDLRVAPAPAPAQRTAYVHEGFYLRAGVGAGYMYSSVSDRIADESGGTSAFTVAADLRVGGSPAPGLAMGLGALGHVGMGGRIDGETTGALFHLNVGPFFDAFPNNRDGFHLGVLVGGTMVALGKTISPTSPLWGGGGALWAGWDVWVAPEWSAGVQLQTGGSYATGADASTGIFHTTLNISILNH